MFKGTEYCGYCNNDFNYRVSDNVWIASCKECGRPTLLCDKCYSGYGNHNNCSMCPHTKERNRLEREWKKTQIGKIVWYENDENPLGCGWFKVVGFTRSGAFKLKALDGKVTITNFGNKINFHKKCKKTIHT